jgi:hypothetical protein
MKSIFPELPRQLGVYTLTRLIELRKNTALYEARQTHVDRAVVLEVLTPGAAHKEEVTFLAQARLRVASSELPHVANVYESLRAEGHWFLTQELPLGRSLAEIAAAGEQLSVPLLCCIISAAAEMYDLCSQVELHAMPLAPSSIFIEDSGEVHFLSPLVEGTSHSAEEQMQALATALSPVCPQHKSAGLGRTITLIQWMAEGYEGTFLPWNTLGETASTILQQLAEDARIALESSLSYKIRHNPFLLKVRQFTRRWAFYIITYASIIITLSCMGTLFGLADPVHTSAKGVESILCHQGGESEFVLRKPVSMAEYDDFIQTFDNMSDEERNELLDNLPGEITTIEPADWDSQWNNKSQKDPVTGVTYWQALAYANYHGGTLPSVNQLQALKAAGVKLHKQEWTRSEQESPEGILYGDYTYLLINSDGKPVPSASRNYQRNDCSFRICLPQEDN